MREICSIIAPVLESGVGIEVNPSGLKYSVGEIYPSDPLLSLYLSKARARGVEPIVTLGSDAHRVEDVGARPSEGVKALQRAGHNTITLFERREQFAFHL